MSDNKSYKLENKIGDYEWLIEWSEENWNDQFSGFAVEFTIGSRWSNHSYISFGSAFLGKDDVPKDLIPSLQDVRSQVDSLIYALSCIKNIIDNKVGEVSATGTIN